MRTRYRKRGNPNKDLENVSRKLAIGVEVGRTSVMARNRPAQHALAMAESVHTMRM
jgi:hypothetical protein